MSEGPIVEDYAAIAAGAWNLLLEDDERLEAEAKAHGIERGFGEDNEHLLARIVEARKANR